MLRRGLAVGWRVVVGGAILVGLGSTAGFGGVVVVVVLLLLVLVVALAAGGPSIKISPAFVTHTASTPLPTQRPPGATVARVVG